MIHLGIRYCGGCNPAYDRLGLVERIRERLLLVTGEEVSVVLDGGPADATLVVCGCPTCCADKEERKGGPAPYHVLGSDLMDYRSTAMEEIPARVADELAAELKRRTV